jgi:hypothetical protein
MTVRAILTVAIAALLVSSPVVALAKSKPTVVNCCPIDPTDPEPGGPGGTLQILPVLNAVYTTFKTLKEQDPAAYNALFSSLPEKDKLTFSSELGIKVDSGVLNNTKMVDFVRLEQFRNGLDLPVSR